MRYFFHVKDGQEYPDTVGTEFADDEAARKAAVRASSEAIFEVGITFWRGGEWQMHVVDENGRNIAQLRFQGWIDPPRV